MRRESEGKPHIGRKYFKNTYFMKIVTQNIQRTLETIIRNTIKSRGQVSSQSVWKAVWMGAGAGRDN